MPDKWKRNTTVHVVGRRKCNDPAVIAVRAEPRPPLLPLVPAEWRYHPFARVPHAAPTTRSGDGLSGLLPERRYRPFARVPRAAPTTDPGDGLRNEGCLPAPLPTGICLSSSRAPTFSHPLPVSWLSVRAVAVCQGLCLSARRPYYHAATGARHRRRRHRRHWRCRCRPRPGAPPIAAAGAAADAPPPLPPPRLWPARVRGAQLHGRRPVFGARPAAPRQPAA